MTRRTVECSSGQSLVEVVALAPIIFLCGLLGLQALIAGATFVFADNAAHSGALAAQLEGNPTAAARDSLPGWASGRVQVQRIGNQVVVRLEPRAVIPQLSKLLAVKSSARFVESGAVDGS